MKRGEEEIRDCEGASIRKDTELAEAYDDSSGVYSRRHWHYVKKPECPALPNGDEWPCGFGGGPTTSVGDQPPQM